MDIDCKIFYNVNNTDRKNKTETHNNNIFDENEIQQQMEKEENDHDNIHSKKINDNDNMLLIHENQINIISTPDEIRFRRKLYLKK